MVRVPRADAPIAAELSARFRADEIYAYSLENGVWSTWADEHAWRHTSRNGRKRCDCSAHVGPVDWRRETLAEHLGVELGRRRTVARTPARRQTPVPAPAPTPAPTPAVTTIAPTTVTREEDTTMADTSDQLTATFTIEREPKGSGGRRFSETAANRDDQVIGTLYVSQHASKLLGDPAKLRIIVEAIA
jgi:hypothetical protein